ncbi:MAG: hypothetical protein KatS3mg124_1546 [Porticoccaceae bacterium]|nr:MAG: hypothetical protein KatS3mg124_1546 [Porticoccaceae bacterium]
MGRYSLAVLMVAAALLAVAAQGLEIEARALFPGRAVLAVGGVLHTLAAGEATPEGVRLLSATPQEAVVEVDGRRLRLGLANRIGTRFAPPPPPEVAIPRGPDGHYRVEGAIEGRPVTLVVDTGATLVALSAAEAARLGLDLPGGRPGRAMTAAGPVEGVRVRLGRIRVGGIELYGVDAMVLPGDHPREVLLGNSFLERLELERRDGVLVLRRPR